MTGRRQALVAQRAALVTVINEMRSDGDLDPGIDADVLIDAIVGAYIAERARTGQVHDDWESRLVAMLRPAARN